MRIDILHKVECRIEPDRAQHQEYSQATHERISKVERTLQEPRHFRSEQEIEHAITKHKECRSSTIAERVPPPSMVLLRELEID